MKVVIQNKIHKIHNVFHGLLLAFCFIWIVSDMAIEAVPSTRIAPIYRDAIKAVDPLEYFKDSDTHKDFVEF